MEPKTADGGQVQGGHRAAIYARVSDREQAEDDKVSLAPPGTESDILRGMAHLPAPRW